MAVRVTMRQCPAPPLCVALFGSDLQCPAISSYLIFNRDGGNIELNSSSSAHAHALVSETGGQCWDRQNQKIFASGPPATGNSQHCF